MSGRAAALAAAGLLLFPAGGCGKRSAPDGRDAGAPAGRSTRKPEVAVLRGVAIRWTGERPRAGPSDEELSGRVAALLAASPAFVGKGETAPPGRAPVDVTVEMTLHAGVVDAPGGAAGARAAMVGVEAELDWQDGGERLRPHEKVLVHRPLEGGAAPDPLLAAETGDAVELAGAGLAAKETLRQGDDAAVLAALGADDPDQVLWALDLAADRRLAAAFDRAVALLDARDPGVQGAALRVLVALRDPRAVKPLARRADFADPDTMRALVEAMTAIGGSEAIEFLELVAGGHADPDMRQRAQEGLERLGRRRPGTPP
jgi:hypothetical protein